VRRERRGTGGAHGCGRIGAVATPPDSTKTSLSQRLTEHARTRWPDVRVQVRFRGAFAYVSAVRRDGQAQPLCRLRYAGSASIWGFAFYRASHDDYEPSYLPSGMSAGTPEEALDCAAGVYLDLTNDW
jgi:choline dehydrogenase-like flavoprotein